MTPARTPTSYRLPFFHLRVDWPDDAVADLGDRMLAYHGFRPTDARRSDPPDARFLVTATDALPALPPDAREVNRHASGLRVLRSGTGTIFRVAGLRVDLPPGDAPIRVALSEAERPLEHPFDRYLFLALTLALLTVLQRRQFYAIHAAAVCLDPQAGIVFVADSDAGKSTLTLSLVRQGWRYVSDDSIFVHPTETAVEARPLRRVLGLDPEFLAASPELAAAAEPQLTDPSKWAVDLERVLPGRLVERCTPGALVFPRIEDRARSALEPLDARQALVRLLTQNSFIETDRGSAQAHLDALARLVRQCRLYTLAAGRDLRTDPSAADALLRPLVHAAP